MMKRQATSFLIFLRMADSTRIKGCYSLYRPRLSFGISKVSLSGWHRKLWITFRINDVTLDKLHQHTPLGCYPWFQTAEMKLKKLLTFLFRNSKQGLIKKSNQLFFFLYIELI
jgi:hypothetical protein